MYCYLEEVWPQYNSNIRQPNVNTNNSRMIETFNYEQPLTKSLSKSLNDNRNEHMYENIHENINIDNHEYFLKHMETCQHCQMLLNKYRSDKIIKLLSDPKLKETIVVFLLGILIILILNLIIK